MSRTVVSRNFEIVIPEDIRRQVPIEQGQVLQVVAKDGVITLVPERALESLRGILEGADIGGFREKKDRF